MTTTPRVTIEDLALDSAPNGAFELLAHRTSDGREVRITLASALALVNIMTGGTGWTIAANAPANPTLGQGWFDSANGEFRIWTGALWELIGPLPLDGFSDAEARRLANLALTRIMDEATARTSGDMLTYTTVSTEAALNAALTAQETSAEALEIEFTADVTSGSDTYVDGQVVHLAPMSRAIERKFIIPRDTGPSGPTVDRDARTAIKTLNAYLADPLDTTPYRIYQADHQPGILAVGDLDGDYLLVLKNPRAMISGAAIGNEDRIDELRVFITNGGISQRVHAVDPWTYPLGSPPVVIPFNISDAEELSVAASITGNEVEFRIAPYSSNGAVGTALNYSMPISPAFQAPVGGGGGGGGDVTAQQLAAERTARQDADATLGSQIDAVSAKADANETTLENMPVFANYTLNPPGMDGIINLPDLIVLNLTTKTVDKTITRIAASIAGTPMADVRQNLNPTPPATDPAAPFNDTHYQQSGGIVNLTPRNAQDRNNLIGAIAIRQDDGFIEGQIDYTFSDGTSATDYFQFLIDTPALSPDIRSIGARLTLSAAGELSADAQGGGGGSARAFGTAAGQINPAAEGNSPARWAINKVLTAAQQAVVNGVAFTTALRDKLTALPTRAALTAELNAITAASNFLVDDPTSPIAPTDANADKILVRGGRLYENILHSATDPIVNYRDFVEADWRTAVGDAAAEWGGVVQVVSPANQHPANYGLYSIPGAHFLRRFGSAFPASYSEFTPQNWRGPADSKDRADEQVTGIGDIVYYGGQVRVVIAPYTAGTTRHRTWEPIESVPSEASVTFDKLADVLLASREQVESGEADRLATAAIIKAYVEAFVPDLRGKFDTASTPVAGDRWFFTDENQTDDPVRYVTHRNLHRIFATAEDWSSIPQGTAIGVGMVVYHNGSWWGAIVAHNRTGTGPDGDATNWLRLGGASAPTATTTRQGTVELATQAEMDAGTANRVPDALVALASINKRIINGFATAAGGTILRLRRADGLNNVDIPINRIVTDGTILDAIQPTRTEADRGKVVTVASTSEDLLSLSAPETTALEPNSVTAAQARANTDAHKKEWRDRIEAMRSPAIRNSTFDTTITAADIDRTVQFSGAVARRFTLPDIDGTNVAIGATVHIVNDGQAALTLDGSSTDLIEGVQQYVLLPHEAVTLQAINSTNWVIISDAFLGSTVEWNDIPMGAPIRIGQIVTHAGTSWGAIVAHNRTGTGPDGDATNWQRLGNLDQAGTLGLLSGAITPTQMNADAASEKAAFRALFNSNNIGVGTAFPAATATNPGDVHIFPGAVASGLSWRDRDGTTALTSAQAGDVGIYVGGRFWQRIGNISDPLVHLPQLRAQTITSAAAITWNVASGATGLLTLGVNATLRVTGGASGDTAQLVVTQDGTGSRTLALHSSVVRFSGVAAPVLKTDANAVDVLLFLNIGGTWNFLGLVGAVAAAPAGKDLVLVGSENVDVTTARRLVATNIDIPSSAMWGAVRIVGEDVPVLAWISLADLRAKTPASNTNNATTSNAVGLEVARYTGSGVGRVLLLLGRTSANKLLVSTNSTSDDPMPLELYRFE